MSTTSAVLKPFKWFYHEFGLSSIHTTGRDAYLIILARTCRMFAYGTNSLILAIFFSALKYTDHQIGLFMTLTLLGDVFLGTALTLIADRVGRRNVLLGGSALMISSGFMFAIFENFWVLLLAAIVGVISVTGGDFGPFRSVEESILSQLTTQATRSDVFAWYVTTSTLGSSLGSEASGRIIRALQNRDGWTDVDAYHTLFWIYAAMGLVNVVLVLALSKACELESEKGEASYAQVSQDENTVDRSHHDSNDNSSTSNQQQQHFSLTSSSPPSTSTTKRLQHWPAKLSSYLITPLTQISPTTRTTMYKLWFLLSVDSLADGMVPYSLTNYYIDLKFHPTKSTLGDVTSLSYFLSSIGAVFAGPLARKIGLVNTMVFTHVPSSASVLVFPLPPYFWMTSALLLVRAGLNNMDQAPRAALVAAVVRSEERTAVMGITSMLRTLAAMAGPSVTGLLAASGRFWIAFVVAGVFRLAYDFGLWALFVNVPLYRYEGAGNAKGDDDEEERDQRMGGVEMGRLGDESFSLSDDFDDDDGEDEDEDEQGGRKR